MTTPDTAALAREIVELAEKIESGNFMRQELVNHHAACLFSAPALARDYLALREQLAAVTREGDEAREEAQFQRGCARMLETEKAHREALVVALAGPLEAYVRECEKQDIKLGPITGDAVEALSAPEVQALVAKRETGNG